MTHPLLFMVGFTLGAYLVWRAVKAAFASGPGGSSASSSASSAATAAGLAAKKLGAGAGGLVSRGGYAPIPAGAKRE